MYQRQASRFHLHMKVLIKHNICLQIINQQLPPDRVSKQTMDVTKASLKLNTRKSYESVIKQWITFCNTRNYDVSPPSVYAIIAFFTELFGKGLSYSHINKARSALSVTLSINKNKIGNNPLICSISLI